MKLVAIEKWLWIVTTFQALPDHGKNFNPTVAYCVKWGSTIRLCIFIPSYNQLPREETRIWLCDRESNLKWLPWFCENTCAFCLFWCENCVLALQDIQFQGKELRDAPAPLGYHWDGMNLRLFVRFVVEVLLHGLVWDNEVSVYAENSTLGVWSVKLNEKGV